VKSLFLHRRKFLRANVLAALKHHASKEQVDALLADMNFEADIRTEQIDVETMLEFTEKVRRVFPEWKL
jgi:16S rRNA (adenine1518-N6/adenine1519-N6)-dimethyltransferase